MSGVRELSGCMVHWIPSSDNNRVRSAAPLIGCGHTRESTDAEERWAPQRIVNRLRWRKEWGPAEKRSVEVEVRQIKDGEASEGDRDTWGPDLPPRFLLACFCFRGPVRYTCHANATSLDFPNTSSPFWRKDELRDRRQREGIDVSEISIFP
ncbi:hypothetical protein Syun_005326 [Stephania yunnanensis]|uniref:Uncharacterized protein n=1 Tax=Stephania yunnanensis TaxID=152371 RepID=A0AAP0Q3C6_9MAGN